MKIVERKAYSSECSVGDLAYGTVFKHGPSTSNGPIYMKVDKNKTNDNDHVDLKWTSGYCICANLKLGTLRALKGGQTVTVLDAVLEYNEEEVDRLWLHKK